MELLKQNLKEKCEELGAVSVPRLSSEDCIKEFLERGHVEGVPKFFSKLSPEEAQFKLKIRDEARELLLRRKSQNLFDHDELTVSLYDTMKKNASPPYTVDEFYINYLDFKKMVSTLCPRGQKMLNSKVFMKLMMDDPYGRVSITVLFNYVMRKTWIRQTRIGLSIYDEAGKGFIKAEGLDSYITELIPTLGQLSGMDETLIPFYVCTAARKFFFFLDPNRTGRIKILDILSCGFIDELLDLRENEPPKLSNWFSVQSVMKIYGHYLNLDRDHSGMLSKGELIYYGRNMNLTYLTETFIDRVFQEYLTFDGEMDYRSYLDFVLAMENKSEPQSIQYFFRLLDLDQKGYLDAFTLHYFFRDIQKYLDQNNAEGICFADVKDEIFDMVKPKDPHKITLQDLISSGVGALVIAILIDCQGFWNYETRETLIPDMKNAENGRISSQV